jgi:hypothetical protein
MFRLARVFLVYLLLGAPQAHAEAFDEEYGKLINDNAAREAIRLALTKIGSTMCESTKPCSPATSEEFTQPPITIIDARTAMAFGIKSALAQ